MFESKCAAYMEYSMYGMLFWGEKYKLKIYHYSIMPMHALLSGLMQQINQVSSAKETAGGLGAAPVTRGHDLWNFPP